MESHYGDISTPFMWALTCYPIERSGGAGEMTSE